MQYLPYLRTDGQALEGRPRQPGYFLQFNLGEGHGVTMVTEAVVLFLVVLLEVNTVVITTGRRAS